MTDQTLDDWHAKRAARTGRANALPQDGQATGRSPADERDPRNPTADMSVNPITGAPVDAPEPNSTVQPNTDYTALRQQLDAANGRVAPLQQQLASMQALLDAERQQRAALEAQAQQRAEAEERAAAEARARDFDPFASLTDDQRRELDPTVQDILGTAMRNLYTQMAPKQDAKQLIAETLAERDRRDARAFVAAHAEASGLQALVDDPAFKKFVAEDDSAELLLNTFAHTTEPTAARTLAPRITSLVKRFTKTANAGGRNPDPVNGSSPDEYLRRGDASGADGNRKAAVSSAEAAALRKEATRLSRMRKFKEADAILARLQ